MKIHWIELLILRAIEGNSYRVLKAVLYVLSLCFQGAVACRSFLYNQGWRKTYKSNIPVVCIGNITAGGTGKTPLVEKLAQDLKENIKLAIVSTGYRSLGVTRDDVITLHDKKNRTLPPEYCGDEPFLLGKHLPNVPVFLSKDRRRSIEVAERRQVELLLLDDGFQNRSLSKDLSVIVLAVKDLFGKGYYLPRGFLRESPRRLQDADFLCITGTRMTLEEFEQASLQLKAYSTAGIIGAEITPQRVQGDLELDLEMLRGKKVGVFCGIGRPSSFMDTLEALGVQRIVTLLSADHCAPKSKVFIQFLKTAQSKGVEMILCTEKDFVKIPHSQYDILPICYLQSEMRVVYGLDHYEALKNRLIALAK